MRSPARFRFFLFGLIPQTPGARIRSLGLPRINSGGRSPLLECWAHSGWSVLALVKSLLPALASLGEEVSDAGHGFHDFFRASGVGKTQIALAILAKAGAGDGGDAGLLQEAVL